MDAIDVEPSAIGEAKRINSGHNIAYYVCDATTEPFPSTEYDVVVWDGAIGHFAPKAVAGMLDKIAAALKPQGIFIGSESLGKEGHDHLQVFETESDLVAMFQPYFTHVRVKSLTYPIKNNIFVRMEAYWRCSNSAETLARSEWLALRGTDSRQSRPTTSVRV